VSSKIKIAMIQQTSFATKDKTIEKTLELIKRAKSKGANLVLLQELHQDSYFCINENEKNFSKADEFEKDVIFWSKIAKKYELVLVASLFEKRAVGIYHNTAVVFEKDGTVAGKYRKMHIPDDPGFYEKFYFTPGDLGFEPIQTSVGKLGVLICWDQWFPEAARLMALGGADILIYPTAIGWFDEDDEREKEKQLDAWINIQKGHAIANGLPLVAINRVGIEFDDKKQIDGIRFWGNSFALGSRGEIIRQASNDKEEVIVFEINLDKSKEARKIWPFFRDRRVESYGNLGKIFIDN
jgi:N-carbamoylputrescine amidase